MSLHYVNLLSLASKEKITETIILHQSHVKHKHIQQNKNSVKPQKNITWSYQQLYTLYNILTTLSMQKCDVSEVIFESFSMLNCDVSEVEVSTKNALYSTFKKDQSKNITKATI